MKKIIFFVVSIGVSNVAMCDMLCTKITMSLTGIEKNCGGERVARGGQAY
jgi:hypothetical protein